MRQKLPTLIDNFPSNTLLETLQALLPQTRRWDIATGFFEVGALLTLEGYWQPIQRIRLVMGDEITKRTRRELLAHVVQQTGDSIEVAKERDDFAALKGLEAVRAALQDGRIRARIYPRAKFHAKAHRLETEGQPVDYALIGSSNFTEPGLTENVELNLFTTDASQINALKEWFERIWSQAENVVPELLRVIERHLRAFTPFEVWAKALHEYFAGREAPLTEWEEKYSMVFPLLSRYQQDGYRQARAIADRWGGALICDGVGLGKTYIGAMLLEYHLQQGDRILLIVPKSARKSVWEKEYEKDPMYLIRRHYPVAYEEHVWIHNQTDFGREGTVPQKKLDYYRDYVQVILIDEAHHFRTPWANRSKVLRSLLDGGTDKKLYFLTATPINNSLRDLYHLVNYLARDHQNYFAPLGIHHLQRHFHAAEQRLEALVQSDGGSADVQTAAQDADLLRTDQLLKALVIQRSRAYVKDVEKHTSDAPLFPEREKPRVIPYSLRSVYSALYDRLKTAFDRDEPLLSLTLYNPEVFRKDQPDTELLNRDRQVIGLIRTLLLKRLESSYKAFEVSLEDLLRKMGAFLGELAPDRWEGWKEQHTDLWRQVQHHQQELNAQDDPEAEVEEGNEFDDLEVRRLDKPEAYHLHDLLAAVEADMDLLAELLGEVYTHLSPDTDDKVQQLVHVLRTDPHLKEGKVVVFTEFRDTARYLWRQLRDGHGFADVEELDSTRKVDREEVIKRFSPYYNATEGELPRYLSRPIRLLISTDVLSEGLNLQDAQLIVNYDLHWNPVRLMQRIGRVDRRLNPEIERRLNRDGGPVRIYPFNFLPPDELEDLLHLHRRVTGKLLRISKTLGIEAPLLTPEEEWDPLRLFNEKYEGTQSVEEKLHLELERLRQEHPRAFEELKSFPRRIFSGKRVEGKGVRGLFCCYRFPNPRDPEAPGEVRWYFRGADTGEIWESAQLQDIANAIRSTPDTPRVTYASPDDLKAGRREIEVRVCTYLRDLQAPMGAKATLICWMEVW